MIATIFGLPKVPGGDEDFSLWTKVLLNLLEDKELVLDGWQMMDDGKTKNGVKRG